MSNYFASFRVVGEVVETFLCETPQPRLLIDIAAETPGENAGAPAFLWRSTFSIQDPELIQEFQTRAGAGDVISAEGRFWQESYVPQGGVHVDTTFLLQSFEILKKAKVAVMGFNPFVDLRPDRTVN